MKSVAIDWDHVFRIRCKAKRGEALSDAEQDLIRHAFVVDHDRYAAMSDAVFRATAPFGSIR